MVRAPSSVTKQPAMPLWRRLLGFGITNDRADAQAIRSPSRSHYDVIADGVVVGRIMMFTTTPAGQPWVWTIAPGYEEDRAHMHGYAETNETAVEAFAWGRE
jgi:hypothetical protein